MIFLHDTAIIPISQNIVVVVGVGQHFPIGWWKAMRKTHWRGALGSSGESPECFRWDTCEGLGTFVGPPSKWSFLDAHRFCLYRFRQGGAQPLCRVPIQLNLHSLAWFEQENCDFKGRLQIIYSIFAPTQTAWTWALTGIQSQKALPTPKLMTTLNAS